ncbi:hypothetical protein MKEN_00837300 [Mycena kentingensis (nom. inval.)]|nr:hypothetical protein MKEN_00837300 [Mycena kentingensis (nom. inval.)]
MRSLSSPSIALVGIENSGEFGNLPQFRQQRFARARVAVLKGCGEAGYPVVLPVYLFLPMASALFHLLSRSREDESEALRSYGYIPTEAVAIVFLVLFGISTALHTAQAAYYRVWWLFPTAVLCGLGELIGWGARLWSAINNNADMAFTIQISTTIIAPTPLLAAFFVIFARVVNQLGPHYSLIPGKYYGWIFVPCDMIALVVQGVGGGIASAADDNLEQANRGAKIMLGGIGFQFAVLVIFSVLLADFIVRVVRDAPWRAPVAGPGSEDVGKTTGMTRRTALVLGALAFSTTALFIRSVYRTIELNDGWLGRIIHTQVYFNVLDGAMVVLAIFTWNFVHPGVFLFPRKRKDGAAPEKGGDTTDSSAREDELLESHALRSYGYIPSESIAIVFLVLFGISTALHTAQAAYYRVWWLLPTAVLCGFGELIGWGARLWSALNENADMPFTIQISTTIIAPTPLLAASFIIFARVVNELGPRYSLIPAKYYGWIFVPCDIIALAVQGVGGGIASSADNDLEKANRGAKIMLGGIGFQFAVIVIFAFLLADFIVRVLRDAPWRLPAPAGPDSDVRSTLTRRTALVLGALAFSTTVLFIRSVYRVRFLIPSLSPPLALTRSCSQQTIELNDGWNGRVIHTQVYFNVLDGGMVVLAIYTWNFVHPGVFLFPRKGKGQDGDGDEKQGGDTDSSARSV